MLEEPKVLAVSRLHGEEQQIQHRLPLVQRWFEEVECIAERAVLLVDLNAFQLLQTQNEFCVEGKVQLVEPWTGVSSALNAAVHLAKRYECTHLLVQSLEVRAQKKDLKKLVGQVQAGVLVAGPKLTPSHGKVVGLHELHADSIPWNTMAVWNVGLLGLVGFSPLSDEAEPRPGMEEVVPISLLQKIRPQEAASILISLPGVRWEPADDLTLRRKISSKQARARLQLDRLNVPTQKVQVLP